MLGRNNNNIGFNNMFSNTMNNFYRRNEDEIQANAEQNEENKIKKLPLKCIYNLPTKGIPLEKIDSNSDINKGLICAICLNLMWDPVEIEGCHHTFCKCCIITHLKYKDNCPSCRNIAAKFNDSVAIKRLCQEYKIKCFNEGCKEMPTYSNLETHLKKCAFKKYRCPNEGCKYTGIKSDLKKNHLVICEHRLTDCKYCKKLVKFCNLGKHERTECAQEFECEICHKKMTRGDYFSKHNIPNKDNIECLRNAYNLS